MKYIYLVVVIFLLSGCIYDDNNNEDYNYLDDNSLRFIRSDNDTSILINKNDKYYLLLLGSSNIDNIEVDYLIKYRNINSSIECEEEYLLESNIIINDIEFNVNDKIEIVMNNNKFCIYIKDINKDNFSDCNFIYLYNNDNNFYITLNSNLKGLFYHSYTKFNYKFLHHLTTVWIDSFTIDFSSYTTVTFDDEDFEVSSYKIRGNTVHRR